MLNCKTWVWNPARCLQVYFNIFILDFVQFFLFLNGFYDLSTCTLISSDISTYFNMCLPFYLKKPPQNCELCRNVCTYCIKFWIYFIDVENLVIVKNYYYYQWTLNILGKWHTGNTFQFKRNVIESVKIVVDAHQKNSITHLNFNYLRALHSTVHLSETRSCHSV